MAGFNTDLLTNGDRNNQVSSFNTDVFGRSTNNQVYNSDIFGVSNTGEMSLKYVAPTPASPVATIDTDVPQVEDTTQYVEIAPEILSRFEEGLQNYINRERDKFNRASATAEQYVTNEPLEGWGFGRPDPREAILAGAGLTYKSDDELELEYEQKALAVEYLLNQDQNPVRRKLANFIFDRGASLENVINLTNLSSWVPFYGGAEFAYDIPEIAQTTSDLVDQGEYKSAALVGGLSTLAAAGSLFGGAQLLKAPVNKLIRGSRNLRLNRGYDPLDAPIEVRQAFLAQVEANENVRIAALNTVRENTNTSKNLIADIAEERAMREGIITSVVRDDEGRAKVLSEALDAFEQRTGRTVSKVGPDGNRVVDPEALRLSGRETLADLNGDEIAKVYDEGELIQSGLIPSKFANFVALAADYNKQFPELFSTQSLGKTRLIDRLFEVVVAEDLLPAGKFAEDLARWNLTADEFILGFTATVSEGAKAMNMASQIKRAARQAPSLKTGDEIGMEAAKGTPATVDSALDQTATIGNWFKRGDRLSRFALVSAIQTTARNLETVLWKMPGDVLTSIVDDAIVTISRGGRVTPVSGSGLKQVSISDQIKASFKPFKYVYSRPDLATAWVQHMKQFGLQDKMEVLYRRIGEYGDAYGRGAGGGADLALSKVEDTVAILGTPGMWVDRLLLHGNFLADMERLFKREWGIDVLEALRQGKGNEIFSNSDLLRPKGAMGVEEILEEALARAQRTIYSGKARTVLGEKFIQVTDMYPVKILQPFGRFMALNLEEVYNLSFGALHTGAKGTSVAVKKLLGLDTKGLDGYDRQRVGQNLVGVASVMAFAALQRKTGQDLDRPETIDVGGYEMSVLALGTPGTAWMLAGYVNKFLDGKEDTIDWSMLINQLGGSAFRTGIPSTWATDLKEIIDEFKTGTGDPFIVQRTSDSLARALGNYFSRHIVPFAQFNDAYKALTGVDEPVYQLRSDPEFDDDLPAYLRSAADAFLESSRRRGFFLSGEEAPKTFLFSEEPTVTKEDWTQSAKVFLGLSLSKRDSEAGVYFRQLGLTEWDIGSRSPIPSIQQAQTQYFRNILPDVYVAAKEFEEELRDSISGRYGYDEFAKGLGIRSSVLSFDLPLTPIKESEYLKLLDEDTVIQNMYITSRVIDFVRDVTSKYRAALNDFTFEEIDERNTYLREWLSISQKFKTQAAEEFKLEYNRSPDYTDLTDLEDLILIGRALRKR